MYKQYLHWALKSVNTTYTGLFGSLGKDSNRDSDTTCFVCVKDMGRVGKLVGNG